MHKSQTRRDFLAGMAGFGGLAIANRAPFLNEAVDLGGGAPDVALRIAPVELEVARGRLIRTTGYNGSVPGPLIRFREGIASTIDLINDTDSPEFVHWHGFEIPAEVDGAEEERSLVVPPHGHLRYRMTPTPAGSRYVHSHAMSMTDLSRGTFSGQFGFAYIEPRHNPGVYDQEIFLATHEWDPRLVTMLEEEDSSAPGSSKPEKVHGLEVAYRYFTINGKCLGSGEPIRVKEGERVLIHFLNASATEDVRLALPGHQFEVVALDGNPVPHPEKVDVIELGTAERVDAVVRMDTPGVWVLGSPLAGHRRKGMGIVVEYANRSGKPRWVRPPDSSWDYTIFGDQRPAPRPDAVIPFRIEQVLGGKGGIDQWTLNGKSFDPAAPPMRLAKGRRHRLVFDNQTDDPHPLHLHRHTFELVKVFGQETSGVKKDVVVVKSREKLEVDVIPVQTGLALFHCHQQLHMDYGFKLLFDVV